MAATPEYYDAVLDHAPFDSESVTYVVVTGATPEYVAAAMDIDLDAPHDPEAFADGVTAYGLIPVAGGVVAIENTGYADPSKAALRRLSEGGRRATVVRTNIQGHARFGYARDGELVFDDDEYVFIDDPGRVPEELRELFALAWEDPDSDEEPEGDWLLVAMAMAERATGVEITVEDLRRVGEAGFFRAPMLVYSQDD